MIFAELLREHRRAGGWTQTQLAERANMTERGIRELERGLRLPRPSTVRVLAQALALGPDDAAIQATAARQPSQTRINQMSTRQMNLPRPLTSFVGREREVAQLQRLLSRSPLLTLTGPGGSGKTRLALRLAATAAEQFEDGVIFVPLASVFDAVAELERSEAARLFIDRARAVKPEFAVTAADAGALADVCRHLDGLPLAIELAAARVRLLSLKTMADRLGGRPWQRVASPLTLLSDGARDLPRRQQTLSATIAWSYDLLTAAEQALFRRLAVFFGGASLEAVQACATVAFGVACPPPSAADEVLARVEALVAKGLLTRRSGHAGEPRVDMLETIREFGLERLSELDELQAARQWLTEYYRMLAEDAEPCLRGPDQRTWLDRLEVEHDNLRAALEWALTRGCAGPAGWRTFSAMRRPRARISKQP